MSRSPSRPRSRLATTLAAAALAGAMVSGVMPAQAEPSNSRAAVVVKDLSLPGQAQTLGIDDPTPRLGWKLDSKRRGVLQSAYQVQVGTRPAHADVWDSGRVTSSNSVAVEYAGPKMSSSTRYFWRVRVWDGNGEVTPWSSPARWETGLLSSADWGSARWIGGPTEKQEVEPPPAWPAGTTAKVSSVHPSNPTRFGGHNLIDGVTNTSSYWNDATAAGYPD